MAIKNKKLIRKRMLDLRSQMTEKEVSEKSKLICDSIIKSKYYQNAKTVLVYSDYTNEVKTGAVIQDALESGKMVFCPKVIESEMEFYQIHKESDLKEGYRRILEPDGTALSFTELYEKSNAGHYVIMPGVAYDKQRNRIGYGKGFYDKFLAKYGNVWKVGICYDYQVADEMETNEYDIKADILYTEKHQY